MSLTVTVRISIVERKLPPVAARCRKWGHDCNTQPYFLHQPNIKYKLCIRINLNGVDSGVGKLMALFGLSQFSGIVKKKNTREAF